MSLANNEFSQPSLAFQPDIDAPRPACPDAAGVAACLRAFERLSKLGPGFWLALPVCGDDAPHGFGSMLKPALDGSANTFPYMAIVAEAERPLERGIRAETPLALTLLAALALDRDARDEAALRLAQAALDMAARLDASTQGRVRALHAALVAPLAGSADHACTELAAICEGETILSYAHRYLAGQAFVAGIALPELSRRLERAQRLPADDGHAGAAAELAIRARLFDGLVRGQAPAVLHSAQAPVEAPQDSHFGHWLTRLQAAVYGGDHAAAVHAAGRAAALDGPLHPLADRLACHLFAALALSHSDEAEAAARLDLHRTALRRLAERLPACAAVLVQFADAARARHAVDQMGALRGFDGAGISAHQQGRHWLATLAWEQAALQAEECGLGAAARHYRRQALASCELWGAAGRAAMLRQAWGEAGGQDAEFSCAQQAERERILRAGSVGELGLSIAHEVNQPLAAISLHAAAALKWLRRAEPNIERALSSLSLISAAGQHAGDIVRSIQRLASREEQDMASVPVDRTIADTLRLLRRPLRKHGIEVELALGLGECTIHASRVQLQQVLTNLLVNATEALAGSGSGTEAAPRRIRVQSRRYGEHDIEISVADNGPGIAPQNAGRVFGSLFSTKPNSTGMGLSISLAIVRAHGGQIAYEPCEPHGACFRFRLPVDRRQP
jgi:signal transduction histidine kinase